MPTEPGEDVAPYHDRQIVVLQREDWGRLARLGRAEAELLRPLPTGSLKAQMGHEAP
jgi:putative SOS response-associated peptidase YedK